MPHHLANPSSGNPGYDLNPELDVYVADRVATKRRFSPFVVGASDLRDILQEMGVENLILAGTATNMCSESTARDATMRTRHGTTTTTWLGSPSFHQSFGDVKTTDETISMISWVHGGSGARVDAFGWSRFGRARAQRGAGGLEGLEVARMTNRASFSSPGVSHA